MFGRTDPVVFSEGDGPGLHVQDAGDGVSLGEGGQCMTQLTPVVQAAAVGTVQPHVCGAAVVVVTDGPARHADTRSLVASVLFCDIELDEKDIQFTFIRFSVDAVRVKVAEQLMSVFIRFICSVSVQVPTITLHQTFNTTCQGCCYSSR